MIIDIKEQQSDKEPCSLKIEDLNISFVVGDEECNYDYDLEKYIGDKPFEKLSACGMDLLTNMELRKFQKANRLKMS